jgi:DNA-binding MltR family transcriptional regulator
MTNAPHMVRVYRRWITGKLEMADEEPTLEQAPPELLEELPYLKDMFAFLYNPHKESDRGLVVGCAALLDDILNTVIMSYLVDNASSQALLEGGNAPLGSFSAKIDMAHALGLISDDSHAEAHNIRKIRNHFAHKYAVSLSDDSPRDRCNNLRFRLVPHDRADEARHGPRDHLISATACLLLNWSTVPHRAQESRLTPLDRETITP